MKNSDIYNIYESLVQLTRNKDIKTTAKTGYLLLKNKNLLEPYYKALIESRYSIIEKYAEKNDQGELIVPPENIDAANKELTDLLAVEEENLQLSKINIENLPDGIDLEILDNLMLLLEE